MREKRLLERIADAVGEPVRRGNSDQEIALDSIRLYLQRILNTRQGSVPIDPEFGVPDFHSMAARFSTDPHESIQEIETGIINTIRKYEPRLKSARINMLDKKEFDISMTLEIQAEMITDQGNIPVVMKAVITSEGRIDILT